MCVRAMRKYIRAHIMSVFACGWAECVSVCLDLYVMNISKAHAIE